MEGREGEEKWILPLPAELENPWHESPSLLLDDKQPLLKFVSGSRAYLCAQKQQLPPPGASGLCIRAPTHTHACPGTHMHTYAHMHTQTHMHTHTCTHMHAQTHTHTHAHPDTCTHT